MFYISRRDIGNIISGLNISLTRGGRLTLGKNEERETAARSLGDGIYDRKYIARRGPSISPINSSIAFRLRPITIYLRGCGVTPPTDPPSRENKKKGTYQGMRRKRRRTRTGSRRGERRRIKEEEQEGRRRRRRRGDAPRESSGPGVRASV